MGIAVISSYRGGYNFEAIGLSRALVGEFFPGMPSRISGIGFTGIARKVLALHAAAWSESAPVLEVGGIYKLRRRGEAHAFDAPLIHMLQEAVATDSFTAYRRYAEATRKMPPIALRDLLAGFRDGSLPQGDADLARDELARRAASRAVRLPEAVPEGEVRALVAALFATTSPLTSPSGRPVFLELTHGELARRFQK